MEITEFLGKFGLGSYEKQAYLALLAIGRCKSKLLAKESKVSYGRIYEILERLETKGLIQSYPTIPKTFEAIDPKKSFELLLRKQEDDILRLRSCVKDLSIPVIAKGGGTSDRTIILHGKRSQLSMKREMDAHARKEVLVIPGIYHPSLPSRVLYHRALRRGVKIKRLLRAVTIHNRDIIRENISLGEEVRLKTLMGLRLHVVDRKEALLSIVDPKTKDRISIYTTNKDFANSMAILFDSLWEKSKKLNKP